jgi:hypothetical protein
MNKDMIPFRWPAAWKSPPAGEWLAASSFTTVLVEKPVSWSVAGKQIQVWSQDSSPPGIHLLQGVWPRVKGESGEARRGAEAGPTGKPWVDSNGWRLVASRVRERNAAHWLTFTPPAGQVIDPRAYRLAVADAETYGGRWAVCLDDDLAKGLSGGNERAIGTWKRMDATLRFFQSHRIWRSYTPVAKLLVISSFAGPVKFLSEEFLNLADRRPLPYRVADPAAAEEADLRGLRGVIYIEPKPPAERLQQKLLSFVERGGLLLTPHAPVEGPAGAFQQNHRIYPRGKGTVAVPEKRWGDPYLLALDTHMLLGREHDVLRLYNAMTMNVAYTANPDGSKAVVEVLNFSLRPATHPVTVAVSKRYRTAAMRTLDNEEGRPLEPVKTRFGIELPLPEFSTYCAIELEV